MRNVEVSRKKKHKHSSSLHGAFSQHPERGGKQNVLDVDRKVTLQMTQSAGAVRAATVTTKHPVPEFGKQGLPLLSR